MFDSINPLLCYEELLCTEGEVLEMLLSLDNKKANGWDSISARMLKSTALSIAYAVFFSGPLGGKIPPPPLKF